MVTINENNLLEIIDDPNEEFDLNEVSDQVHNSLNILESLQNDSISYQDYNISDSVYNEGIDLLSVTPSTNNYTPQAWQINIAGNRHFGEHYLLWAERVYVGNQNYWKYYLVAGRHIEKNGEVYSYKNADWYEYYNYNNVINYSKEERTGSVSGSTYLVYSDLYFDYVGSDPVDRLSPYLIFFFSLIIIIALLRGRNNV